jgi:hypothetical protein
VTKLTAILIQIHGKDIKCEAVGPTRKGRKFMGLVNLYMNGEFHSTLLSSQAIYETPGLAVSEMQRVVDNVRAMDLLTVSGAQA